MGITYARAQLVDTVNGGLYHCNSRCVGRGWLCDVVSGRSFEHRGAWVEARVLTLCEIFAVELYSYVVMSNLQLRTLLPLVCALESRR